jgi:hypothetical protein
VQRQSSPHSVAHHVQGGCIGSCWIDHWIRGVMCRKTQSKAAGAPVSPSGKFHVASRFTCTRFADTTRDESGLASVKATQLGEHTAKGRRQQRLAGLEIARTRLYLSTPHRRPTRSHRAHLRVFTKTVDKDLDAFTWVVLCLPPIPRRLCSQ